jgi:hypothetical protein
MAMCFFGLISIMHPTLAHDRSVLVGPKLHPQASVLVLVLLVAGFRATLRHSRHDIEWHALLCVPNIPSFLSPKPSPIVVTLVM